MIKNIILIYLYYFLYFQSENDASGWPFGLEPAARHFQDFKYRKLRFRTYNFGALPRGFNPGRAA